MCKTIKQRVRFKASPATVYELLADSTKHTAVTGMKATISREVGGTFSASGNDVSGVNVDLVPGRRIVQAWRHRRFPEGIFSMAAVTLTPTRDGGTELVLTHRGVPKDLIPETERAWREQYWSRIKTYLVEMGREGGSPRADLRAEQPDHSSDWLRRVERNSRPDSSATDKGGGVR